MIAQDLSLSVLVLLIIATAGFGIIFGQRPGGPPPPQIPSFINSQTALVVEDGFSVFIGKDSHIPAYISASYADAVNPAHPSYKKLKIIEDDRGNQIGASGIIERESIRIGENGSLYIRSRIVLKASKSMVINGKVDASGQAHAILPSYINNPNAVGTFSLTESQNLGYGGSGGAWGSMLSNGGSNGGNAPRYTPANLKGEGIGAFIDSSLYGYFSDTSGNLLQGGNGATLKVSTLSANGGTGGDAVGGGGAAISQSNNSEADGGGGGYAVAFIADCDTCTMDLERSTITANGASGSLHQANSFASGGGGGGVIAIKAPGSASANLRPKVLEARGGESIIVGSIFSIGQEANDGVVYFPKLFVDQRYEVLDSKHWQGVESGNNIVLNLAPNGEIIVPENRVLYIGRPSALPDGVTPQNAIILNEADIGIAIPVDFRNSLRRVVLGKNAKMVIRTRLALRAQRVIMGDGAQIDADGQQGWVKSGAMYNSDATGSVTNPKFGYGGSGAGYGDGAQDGASAGASVGASSLFGQGSGVLNGSPSTSFVESFSTIGSTVSPLLGGTGASAFVPTDTYTTGGIGGIGVGGGGAFASQDGLVDGGGGGYGLSLDVLQLAVSGKASISAKGARGTLSNSDYASGGGGGGVLRLAMYSVLYDIAQANSSLSYSVEAGQSTTNGVGSITAQATNGAFYVYPENNSQRPALSVQTTLYAGYKVKPGAAVEYLQNFGGNNLPTYFDLYSKAYFNPSVMDPSTIWYEQTGPYDPDEKDVIFSHENAERNANSELVFGAQMLSIDFSIANFCEQSSILKNQVFIGGDGSFEDAILRMENPVHLSFICQTLQGNIYSDEGIVIGDDGFIVKSGALLVSKTENISYNNEQVSKLKNVAVGWDKPAFVRSTINTQRQFSRYSSAIRTNNHFHLQSMGEINDGTVTKRYDGLWGLPYPTSDFPGSEDYGLWFSSAVPDSIRYDGRGTIVVNDHRHSEGDEYSYPANLNISNSIVRLHPENSELAFVVPNGDVTIQTSQEKPVIRIEAGIFAPSGTVNIIVGADHTLVIEGMIVADTINIVNPNNDGTIHIRYNQSLRTRPLPLLAQIFSMIHREALP